MSDKRRRKRLSGGSESESEGEEKVVKDASEEERDEGVVSRGIVYAERSHSITLQAGMDLGTLNSRDWCPLGLPVHVAGVSRKSNLKNYERSFSTAFV